MNYLRDAKVRFLSEQSWIFHLISATHLTHFNSLCDLVNSMSVHHKEKGLVAIGDDEKIVIIDSLQQKQRVFTRLHSNLVSKIAFKPNTSGEVASCGFDYMYNAWDYRTGRTKFKINGSEWLAERSHQSENGVTQLTNPPFFHDFAFVNKGKHSVCVLGDGHIVLVDNSQGNCIARRKGHEGMITNVDSKGIGSNICITGGVDRVVKVWNINEGEINPMGGFAHDAKINYVKCLNHRNENPCLSVADLGKVFIADTSTDGLISVVEAIR